MADDAIRAALDEAARVLCATQCSVIGGDPLEENGQCEDCDNLFLSDARVLAAAGIAAFLRARARSAGPDLPIEWMHECAAVLAALTPEENK